MSGPARILVVGGGLAGAGAALELRRLGYDGRLTVLAAEDRLPYNRPPLSKTYLRGEEDFADIAVAAAEEYERSGVELLLGTRAASIDPARRRVGLAGGEEIDYERLLVATGGRKRRLPFAGADLAGVYDLRTVEDCDRIRAAAASGRRAVVVGLGFVGCEVAASLRMLGLEVVALDRQPAPLARVLGPEVGGAIASLHRRHGVELLLADGVERFEGEGRLESVLTESGRRLDCDLAVAGIGIEPETELLAAAGARVSNGVEVDAGCRTSLPDVFAAGDMALHDHPVFGRIRVEHWNNADKQGRFAARSMLGGDGVYDYIHSFWSDQFDQKLEYVGVAEKWDRIEVEGSLQELDFIVRYFAGGRLRAAAAMGRGGDPERDEEGDLKKIALQIARSA